MCKLYRPPELGLRGVVVTPPEGLQPLVNRPGKFALAGVAGDVGLTRKNSVSSSVQVARTIPWPRVCGPEAVPATRLTRAASIS